MSNPLVSAIVLNYRSPAETLRCVEALKKQSIANDLEIIVIDNHSEDDSIGTFRNRLRKISGVTLLENSANAGYGQGNMFAINRAVGRYLLIINPDNELSPDALEKMVQTMEADPTIGIIAPKLIHEDGTIRESSRTFPTVSDVFIKRTVLRHLFPKRLHHYLQRQENPDLTRDVDWVAGACFLIRRDVLTELGGFDPRFFLFFEDTDLCRRCWEAGKRVVYFPAATALDRKRRLSEGSLPSLLLKRAGRAHLASAMKYFWKWRRA